MGIYAADCSIKPLTSLPRPEQLLNRTFLALLGFCVFYALLVEPPEADRKILGRILPDRSICIEISGAVKRPGFYSIRSGTPLHKVLHRARPFSQADLFHPKIEGSYWKNADGKIYLESSCCITIEVPEKFEIFLEGAVVEPRSLWVASGSRICDLKNRITMNSQGDRAFFRRTRLLKPGEVLKIPEKN